MITSTFLKRGSTFMEVCMKTKILLMLTLRSSLFTAYLFVLAVVGGTIEEQRAELR